MRYYKLLYLLLFYRIINLGIFFYFCGVWTIRLFIYDVYFVIYLVVKYNISRSIDKLW
jgi:hypothetical protein